MQRFGKDRPEELVHQVEGRIKSIAHIRKSIRGGKRITSLAIHLSQKGSLFGKTYHTEDEQIATRLFNALEVGEQVKLDILTHKDGSEEIIGWR